jgi:hypothetical protein
MLVLAEKSRTQASKTIIVPASGLCLGSALCYQQWGNIPQDPVP